MNKKERLWHSSNVLLCHIDKGSGMMAIFMKIWNKLESFWKMDLQLRKCFYQTGLWISSYAFSWLTINGGEALSTVASATPELVVLVLFNKADWESHGEQVIKQDSSMDLYNSSCLQVAAWTSVPALTSLDDRLQIVSWNKPFPP